MDKCLTVHSLSSVPEGSLSGGAADFTDEGREASALRQTDGSTGRTGGEERLHHAHPVMILEFLWRFLFLLILPLARGFVSSLSGGFYLWLQGAWFDLLVVTAIVGLAFCQWFFFRFRLVELEGEGRGLMLVRGILHRQVSLIPVSRICTMSTTASFYLRPVAGVRLRADTLAGGKTPDLSFTVTKRQAEKIINCRFTDKYNNKYMKRSYQPRQIYIVALSAVLSNSLAGVVLLSVLISNLGKILGQEFERRILGTVELLTNLLAFGLPPVAAALGWVLVAGWLLAFFRNLVRHARFTVTRHRDQLFIESGIFTKRKYSVYLNAVNYLDIRQSVFTKVLGLYSVFVHAVGYGKQQEDISAILPAASKRELRRQLRLLLPAYKPADRRRCTIRPNRGAVMKFMTEPLWACILPPAAGWLLTWLFPSWQELIWFVVLMGEIPAVWFFIIRFMDYLTSGLHYDSGSGMYTLRYSSGFYLHTVVIPKEKIVQLELRQSILQKLDGRCDVFFYTEDEGVHRHHLRNLDRSDMIKKCGFEDRPR